MAGKTTDPKGVRITVRITDSDLSRLQAEARLRSTTVGAVVRSLIRDSLPKTLTAVEDEGPERQSA
jgi:hypothetical protein